jgi:hypothetical protein
MSKEKSDKITYKPYDQGQGYLIPQGAEELIPGNLDCGSRKWGILSDKRGQWVSPFHQRKEQERTRFRNEILEPVQRVFSRVYRGSNYLSDDLYKTMRISGFKTMPPRKPRACSPCSCSSTLFLTITDFLYIFIFPKNLPTNCT